MASAGWVEPLITRTEKAGLNMLRLQEYVTYGSDLLMETNK